jgi:2-polyprenyl-3-methyl-5-hydroxy-6-metoxy-1,4-benzoquinol methylase
MPVLAEPIKPQTTVPAGPLTVHLCNNCGYVFLKEVIDCSIYNDYIYTPQTSEDVVEYLRNFVVNTIKELDLRTGQCGLEIGSGDGSLCREFNNAGISFTGVEPSKILCKISEAQNKIQPCNAFMSVELAAGIGRKFDLVVVRHVLEHINEFASFFAAIDICLKPEGTLVVEVPYLGDIVGQRQFYAFFFEHLSYFSVTSLANLLEPFSFFINRTKFVYPEGGSVLVHATRKYAPPRRSEQISLMAALSN